MTGSPDRHTARRLSHTCGCHCEVRIRSRPERKSRQFIFGRDVLRFYTAMSYGLALLAGMRNGLMDGEQCHANHGNSRRLSGLEFTTPVAGNTGILSRSAAAILPKI